MQILLSAAEASADRYGADLVTALKRLSPGVQCVGLGGPRMAAAGCELLEDMTARAAMLLGTLSRIPKGIMTVQRCKAFFRNSRPDCCVFLDSPFLNLRLATAAKRAGLRTVYYIAPQAWAWHESRVKRIGRDVDQLACILPFEEAWFTQRGCRATFVGHPLFESLSSEPVDAAMQELVSASPAPRIVLLPGSRKHVVDEVLPGQLEVAALLARQHANASFFIACASDGMAEHVRKLTASSKLSPRIFAGQNPALLSRADLALVASGTATLEVAHHACPMVVMYNSTSKLLWNLVGRRIVRAPQLSLVNILAGKRLCPEFMPFYPGAQTVFEAAGPLLEPGTNAALRTALRELIAPLRVTGVAERVARMVLGGRGGSRVGHIADGGSPRHGQRVL